MIRFRHADALIEPKPNRPATIAEKPQGGRISLFYGSTFKHGGSPSQAVVVDPTAPKDTEPRELADFIGAPIDEPTCFHGSMVSETHLADPSIQWFKSRFPIEPHEKLRAQAEDALLEFHRAWTRLNWLLPAHRAFALNALWWELGLELNGELALTMLIYDGIRPTDIAALTWNEAESHLLPRTRSLLARWRGNRAVAADAPVFEPGIEQVLEEIWGTLCERGQRNRPRVHLPDWTRIPRSWP